MIQLLLNSLWYSMSVTIKKFERTVGSTWATSGLIVRSDIVTDWHSHNLVPVQALAHVRDTFVWFIHWRQFSHFGRFFPNEVLGFDDVLAIAQGQELTQKLYIVSVSMLSEYQAPQIWTDMSSLPYSTLDSSGINCWLSIYVAASTCSDSFYHAGCRLYFVFLEVSRVTVMLSLV